MWEAQRVAPAPQTAGSAGEGLPRHESPGSSHARVPHRPQAGLGQGDSISLPCPLPEGPRRITGSLVKEINTKTIRYPACDE